MTYCIPLAKIQSKFYDSFLIGIHSMQGWKVTTRHGVARKRTKKDLAICISVKVTNCANREQLNILETFLKYLEFYIVAW